MKNTKINAQPKINFFNKKTNNLLLLKPENCGASCCTCLEKHGLEPGWRPNLKPQPANNVLQGQKKEEDIFAFNKASTSNCK